MRTLPHAGLCGISHRPRKISATFSAPARSGVSPQEQAPSNPQQCFWRSIEISLDIASKKTVDSLS